jgi:hypothetical protein
MVALLIKKCTGCGKALRWGGTRCRACYKLPASPFLENYKWYRERFTPQQQARYEGLVRGRRSRIVQAEAVDVVMREPFPGVCCPKCAAQPSTPIVEYYGPRSSWITLVRYLENWLGSSGDYE